MRELVRARVQLAIGQLLAAKFSRDRFGSPGDLRFEQLMDACILRVIDLIVVPFNQQLMTLGIGERREIRDAPRRVGD